MPITVEQVDELIAKYTIPAHESVVEIIMDELSHAKPDFPTVIKLIAGDVRLSATFLQIANSRLAAINKEVDPFTNVHDAITLLGNQAIFEIVHSQSANEVIQQDAINIPGFWDSAADVAIIAAYLAQRLIFIDPNKAYLGGLFRDTGMAILGQINQNYIDDLHRGAEQGKKIVRIEDELYGVNHQMLSYRLCLEHHLPQDVCWAVLTHHEVEPPFPYDTLLFSNKKALTALIQVAEIIQADFRKIYQGDNHFVQLTEINEATLLNLEVGEHELEDLMHETTERMECLLEAHGR